MVMYSHLNVTLNNYEYVEENLFKTNYHKSSKDQLNAYRNT